MKVLKFGGTSVGDPDAIRKVLDIVREEAANDRVIVVVSAFAGVTNQLEQLPDKVLSNFEETELDVNELLIRHQRVYRELVGSDDHAVIKGLMRDLTGICKGIHLLQEVTENSRDFTITLGELLSSHIVYEYFKQHIETGYFNTREYLCTSSANNPKRIDLAISKARVEQIGSLKKVNVFPGFIASTPCGKTTSLGRGGSDFTASVLASLFNAAELQIWTDVDGIMSADPKYVQQAKVLKRLSYEEALEISHFGAKVIYPPSIQPVLSKAIPITIKNTFAPQKEGTLITKEWDQEKTIIQGISSISNVVTLNLTGTGMMGIPSFSARLFQALSNRQVNIIMITQASSEHSICISIAADELERALEGLKEAFQAELSNQSLNSIEVDSNLAIVALVGSNMINQVGVAGKMFNTLGKNGINIKALAQGSSELNISAVIAGKDLRKALNSLHESFFLSEKKHISLFVIGVGNVGSSFLSQVNDQRDYLIREHNIRITIAGIANTKNMLFNAQGVDLDRWQEDMKNGESFSREAFVDQMKAMNLRNSIFIDITASHAIAELYKDILRHNISVVTPNKIGASGPYKNYQELLAISQRNNVQFLFETNVAAGLPVISTLKDLIRSGDKIQKIEAVLSGSLNYLFNTYNGSVKFADVIRKAQALGLTEPDPRLDLSGEDVKRKILILARESGKIAEMKDVQFTPFIPRQLTEAMKPDTFYQLVENNENFFKGLYESARSRQARLRVVASYENGNVGVSLREVTNDHPFYYLAGKDNIVLFYTGRYREQPLTIKGAGAGADVTASGIFADILKTSMD